MTAVIFLKSDTFLQVFGRGASRGGSNEAFLMATVQYWTWTHEAVRHMTHIRPLLIFFGQLKNVHDPPTGTTAAVCLESDTFLQVGRGESNRAFPMASMMDLDMSGSDSK